MFEQGFIMREVQKMVQMLQEVLNLKQAGKFDEAVEEIDQAYDRFFDMHREDLHEENWDDIINACSPDGKFLPEVSFALADIINEEGKILQAQKKPEQANQKFRLAVRLYQRSIGEKDAVIPLDVLTKIENLKEKLN